MQLSSDAVGGGGAGREIKATMLGTILDISCLIFIADLIEMIRGSSYMYIGGSEAQHI